MYAISMLLIHLFIWQFLYSDDYDNDYIDDQHNNSADDQCEFCIHVEFHCVHYISHVFRNWLVYCVMPCLGMKRTMSVIRRSVLEKMHIIVIYVERCILWRKPYVYTEGSTIQMMYVMLYFCIDCKLYEFLTCMMYIWTKNVSWFAWYCTLL